mmetsp:Transcript_119545/g.274003  ORF Transcript_119545/g.274003 Transcript_119545/m.274003 type:complete len:100 (-) Transcript_119545:218-517(-)
MITEVDSRTYDEVPDLPKMKEKLEEYLDDYNNEHTHQMPLVIFLDFGEHVARICRIVDQPSGNALLLGVGGSGRQSSSRLAAYICESQVFQIEVRRDMA